MSMQKSTPFPMEKQESVLKYNRIKIPLIMSTKDIVSIRTNVTYVQVFNEENFKTKSHRNRYMSIKEVLSS